MKPISLAFKNYEINPFSNKANGELMIIHQCTNCDHISPNRIAGDDNEYQILSILEETLNLDSNLKSKFKSLGINIITPDNKVDVLISLFGSNYQKYT